MDRISSLPDESLLQILSSLNTKDVLKTSLLSKQWRNLWKWVPKLEYLDCGNTNATDHGKFMRFVDRSLLLNKAPVLERLSFKSFSKSSDIDIGFWVRVAAERDLRDFDYSSAPYSEPIRLPQSLFTCGTLVVLKLDSVSLEDVKFPVSFPLLKTLHLRSVIFLDDESPQKLLSSCKVLEVLVVKRVTEDNVKSFSITVPSLRKLIYLNVNSGEGLFALNAPSLKSLEIDGIGHKCMIEEMPEIVSANVQIYRNSENILASLTSVKRLSLCFHLVSRFPTGKIFHQLVELEVCTCNPKRDLLMSLLKHSPKLRALKLFERHDYRNTWEEVYNWGEPKSVLRRLKLGLETLEWGNYRGWNKEKELVRFVFKNSRSLKKATFSPVATTTTEEKNRMLQELTALARVAT
ncbi:hypothetical protein CARUB_v10027549mg, partial [Capsella rubella]